MNPVLREAELTRAVGAGALTRGRAYARGGRVGRLDWLEDPTRLTGEVQGTARAPYKVTVSFAATANSPFNSAVASALSRSSTFFTTVPAQLWKLACFDTSAA